MKKLILVVAVLVILVWGRQIVGVAIWGALSAWDSIHPTIRNPPSDKYPFPWLKVHHDADVARSGIPFRDTEEGDVTFFSRVAGRWRKLPAKSGSVWKLDDDHALIVYDDHNKGNPSANYAGSDPWRAYKSAILVSEGRIEPLLSITKRDYIVQLSGSDFVAVTRQIAPTTRKRSGSVFPHMTAEALTVEVYAASGSKREEYTVTIDPALAVCSWRPHGLSGSEVVYWEFCEETGQFYALAPSGLRPLSKTESGRLTIPMPLPCIGYHAFPGRDLKSCR